jgi:hypothetical protein
MVLVLLATLTLRLACWWGYCHLCLGMYCYLPMGLSIARQAQAGSGEEGKESEAETHMATATA